MTDFLGLVRSYSERIQNGRDLENIHAHLHEEVAELDDEMTDEVGTDGVVGEAVDVILCALDLIIQKAPDLTDEGIMVIARKKLDKWERLYGVTTKDVSIRQQR